MRYRFTFLLVLVFSLAAAAQSEEVREAFIDKGADAICTCLQGKDELTVANVQYEVGMCMIKFLQQNEAESKLAMGPEFSVASQEQIYKFGVAIGQLAAFKCPDAMDLLVKASSADEAESAPAAEPNALTTVDSVTVTAVTFDYPSVVEVKLANGQPLKLIWWEYFPGAEMLQQTYTERTFRLSYATIDVFDGRTKEYVSRRVLRDLELNE